MIPRRKNTSSAPGEIIRSDYRLNEFQQGVWGHSNCVRERRDMDYWEGGGIQAVRKRQQTEHEATLES